jgi:hypothetical protein
MDNCAVVLIFYTLISSVLLSNDKTQCETDSCTINDKNKGCDGDDISESLDDLKTQFRELKRSMQAEIEVLKSNIEENRHIAAYGAPGKIYWYFSAIKYFSEYILIWFVS